MIRAAIVFFVLSMIAIFLGAYGIAGITMEIGKILLLVFLALSVLSIIGGVLGNKKSHIE